MSVIPSLDLLEEQVRLLDQRQGKMAGRSEISLAILRKITELQKGPMNKQDALSALATFVFEESLKIPQ